MIHEDRDTAADQHAEEEEIREVAPANPERKAMRPARSAFRGCRGGRNRRQAEESMLQQRQNNRSEDHSNNQQKGSGADPYAKAPVFWIMHRSMSGIESNHSANLLAPSCQPGLQRRTLFLLRSARLCSWTDRSAFTRTARVRHCKITNRNLSVYTEPPTSWPFSQCLIKSVIRHGETWK